MKKARSNIATGALTGVLIHEYGNLRKQKSNLNSTPNFRAAIKIMVFYQQVKEKCRKSRKDVGIKENTHRNLKNVDKSSF